MCCGSFFSFEDVVLLRLPWAEAHATPDADTSRLRPGCLVTCFRLSTSDSRFGRGVPSSGRMDWTCCSGVSRASLRNVAAEVKPPVDSSHRVLHCLVLASLSLGTEEQSDMMLAETAAKLGHRDQRSIELVVEMRRGQFREKES